MAFEIPGDTLGTQVAQADYSAVANQYKLVKIHTNGNIILCSVAGERAIGVLQNKPKAGQAAAVYTSGVSKVLAGAAVAAGALVTPDATGRAITGVATNHVCGVALTAAAAAGEVIAVRLGYLGVV